MLPEKWLHRYGCREMLTVVDDVVFVRVVSSKLFLARDLVAHFCVGETMQFFEGDRVAHFKTLRQGTVTYVSAVSSGKMIIVFDDGKEEWRWCGAFVKGPRKSLSC